MTKTKFLGIKEPDFAEVGDALAKLIKKRIVDAPGNRWNKTGHLLASITAVERKDGFAVVASNDRLQKDEVAEKFAEEIIPTDLNEATRRAIVEAVFGAFKVEK